MFFPDFSQEPEAAPELFSRSFPIWSLRIQEYPGILFSQPLEFAGAAIPEKFLDSQSRNSQVLEPLEKGSIFPCFIRRDLEFRGIFPGKGRPGEIPAVENGAGKGGIGPEIPKFGIGRSGFGNLGAAVGEKFQRDGGNEELFYSRDLAAPGSRERLGRARSSLGRGKVSHGTGWDRIPSEFRDSVPRSRIPQEEPEPGHSVRSQLWGFFGNSGRFQLE